MVKAFFVDFYGTVVYEDGEIVSKISDLIYKSGHVSPVPVYVVSNIDTDDVMKAIAYHGLKPAGVFTSEDAKSYKPRKEIFELALKETGLNADEVIHIGDSISSDVKGTFELGIRTLWLNRFDKVVPDGVEVITNLLEAFDKI